MLALVAMAPGVVVPVAPPVVPPSSPPAKTQDEGMSPLFWAGIAIGSVGAAGLIVSGVTGGIAMADHGTLEDLKESGACREADGIIDCDEASTDEAHDAIARGETLSVVSTVTLFAGAGLAATGVVLAVVGATSASDESPPVGFAPIVGPGALGAVVSGRF